MTEQPKSKTSKIDMHMTVYTQSLVDNKFSNIFHRFIKNFDALYMSSARSIMEELPYELYAKAVCAQSSGRSSCKGSSMRLYNSHI